MAATTQRHVRTRRTSAELDRVAMHCGLCDLPITWRELGPDSHWRTCERMPHLTATCGHAINPHRYSPNEAANVSYYAENACDACNRRLCVIATPAWAEAIAHELAPDYALVWQRKSAGHGLQGYCVVDPEQPRKIVVRIGVDEAEDRMTLLHECAHARCPVVRCTVLDSGASSR